MSWEDAFTPSQRGMARVVYQFLRKKRHASRISIQTSIAKDIPWQPSLHFVDGEFVVVCFELSEAVYPPSLQMLQPDLTSSLAPMRVSVTCPAEAFFSEKGQRDARKLREHGFGLSTVDREGVLTEHFSGVPLNQWIADGVYDAQSRHLPRRAQSRVKSSFIKYCGDPLSGLRDLTELAEHVLQQVIDAAYSDGKIDKKTYKKGGATALDAAIRAGYWQNHAAPLGGLRNYMRVSRNVVHHSPKTKQQALRRLADTRHGFLEGVRVIGDLMKVARSISV